MKKNQESMNYNFDEIIERKGTDTYKYANMKKVCGREDVFAYVGSRYGLQDPSFRD